MKVVLLAALLAAPAAYAQESDECAVVGETLEASFDVLSQMVAVIKDPDMPDEVKNETADRMTDLTSGLPEAVGYLREVCL